MRLLTGPAVFTKRYASFTVSPQDWLHDWLTRACMSCLAFSGPTPSSSSSPVGAWPAAQPRAAPAPRWATAAVRTARARAALHGLPLVRLAHWLLGGKGQQIHPRSTNAAADTSRTLKKENAATGLFRNRERRSNHCELSKRLLRCIFCFGIHPRWPATTPSVRQQTEWGGRQPRVKFRMVTTFATTTVRVAFCFNILCPATWGPALLAVAPAAAAAGVCTRIVNRDPLACNTPPFAVVRGQGEPHAHRAWPPISPTHNTRCVHVRESRTLLPETLA